MLFHPGIPAGYSMLFQFGITDDEVCCYKYPVPDIFCAHFSVVTIIITLCPCKKMVQLLVLVIISHFNLKLDVINGIAKLQVLGLSTSTLPAGYYINVIDRETQN